MPLKVVAIKKKKKYIKTTMPMKVNVCLPINTGVFIACRSGHFDRGHGNAKS